MEHGAIKILGSFSDASTKLCDYTRGAGQKRNIFADGLG